MIPATQMERELMAPSTGPISIARAVPMPWAAVPMASQRISFIFGIKPYISKQIDRKHYNKNVKQIDYKYGYKYNNSCGIVADGDE